MVKIPEAAKLTGYYRNFGITEQVIMKRFLLFALTLLLASSFVFAGGRKKGKNSVPVNDSEIHWLTLDEAQTAMKKKPRKVWFDVYTSWCGWCKVMDKKTFANPSVAKYMNEHFYAIRLDAEQKDSISFMGKRFGFVPEQRANQFAVEIMQGQMSYPTGVYMEENFQKPMSIPGYQDVATMEVILTYLAQEAYKTTPFPDYQKSFKNTWAATAEGQ